jgi:catechol 2,3-dioxygenase-like lactoylglutathione lyase family enzyme
VILAGSDLVAFVPAVDLTASRHFYQDTLGLPLIADQAPIAYVFDANGTMLRLTAVPAVAVAGYTVLGWAVSNVAGAVDDLGERGVVFLRFDGFPQDERAIWTAPSGDRIAWFSDPATNTLSLTEFVT